MASMSAAEQISADFPFESRFSDVHGSRIHYIDEGTGPPVVFLHGNPTSSYLWRNVIPHLTPHARCIAPDLIGMGKSGKPDISYRYVDHRRYVFGFIEKLGLQNITLVVHDWGSTLGFDYAMQHENNVRGIAFMEAILRTIPRWSAMPARLHLMFRLFRTPWLGRFLIMNRNMFIERVLPMAVIRTLSRDEMERYREPYDTFESRKPLWKWPNEVPIAGQPEDVVSIVNEINGWLQRTKIPMLCFAAEPGVIMQRGLVEWCRSNCANLDIVDLGPGLHYLQEDHPHAIGRNVARWFGNLP